MDYLFVYPIRLQADDPVDVMWPRLGCTFFCRNRINNIELLISSEYSYKILCNVFTDMLLIAQK